MKNSSQKIQNRATLVSIINKYKDCVVPDNNEMQKDIDIINAIEDKEYTCKILLKEVAAKDSPLANICSVFIIDTIDRNIFEKQAMEYLNNEKISDERKFYIISIMKQMGIEFDYENIENFIQNPEELAQSGVQDFLTDAIDDPEVQIDLLDFYLNIPQDERISLLDNLLNEFGGDDLANAFSILVELNVSKEELEYLLNGLLQSNSPYAIEGLEYILKNSGLDKNVNAIIEKALKEIKFANPNFKNENIIKNNKLFKTYISFVDGSSKFSLSVARRDDDGLIDTCFYTIHLLKGIVSCMGFSKINSSNFKSVIKRLFADSIPVEINPVMLKTLTYYYYEKNKQTNTVLPYEFIVWKKMLSDVEDLNKDVSDELNSKLEKVKLTDSKARKISNSKILENWFYDYGQNKQVDELLDKINNEHITSLDKINELVSNTIEEHFINNNDFLIEIHSRLLIQSYVSMLAKLKLSSSCMYSMCFENQYLKTLINIMIDKSIYAYLADDLIDSNQENSDKTVFEKNKKRTTNFNKEEIESLMAQIEAKWN